MFLRVVLIVSLFAVSSNAGCTENIASCVTDLLTNLASHVVFKRELLCGDMKTGIRCIVDQKCPIASNIMSVIDSYVSQFGLDCPFTPSQLVAEYKNDSTKPRSFPAVILTCAVVARLIFMKLWM